MAPKANSSTPSSTFLSTTPTKRPVANRKPDPTLKPNFTHRGVCLSSNSRIPTYLPNAGSPAIVPPQILPLARQKGTGMTWHSTASRRASVSTPLMRVGRILMCGTITSERRCYCYQHTDRPDGRRFAYDGDTADGRGGSGARRARAVSCGPERDQPRPAHCGGHPGAPCWRPGAPGGGHLILWGVARRRRGRLYAHGGRALRSFA